MIQFGKYKIKFDFFKINASYSKQVVQVQNLLKHVSKLKTVVFVDSDTVHCKYLVDHLKLDNSGLYPDWHCFQRMTGSFLVSSGSCVND